MTSTTAAATAAIAVSAASMILAILAALVGALLALPLSPQTRHLVAASVRVVAPVSRRTTQMPPVGRAPPLPPALT